MWPTIADEAAMDFNEQYKYQLGWIADSKVKTLNSGSGTTYNLKIYACDDPNTLASSTKAPAFSQSSSPKMPLLILAWLSHELRERDIRRLRQVGPENVSRNLSH